MISIRELAKICNVSRATITRAFKDYNIHPKTKDKILVAAKKYGYYPSTITKEVILGKSDVVGYIAPFVAPVYQADFTKALQQKLYEDNLQVFIAPSWDEKTLYQSMERFASRRVKAIIVTLPTHLSQLPETIISSIPTLSINLQSRQEGVYSLVPNFQKSGIDAAKYFINKGHKYILYIKQPNEKEHLQIRENCFKNEIKNKEGYCISIEVDYSNEDWGKELVSLLLNNKKITGIMCSSSTPLNYIVSVLEKNNIDIPNDISMLSGGGTFSMLPLFNKVTNFAYPLDEIMNNLLKWLRNPDYKFASCEFKLNELGSVNKNKKIE